VHALSAGTVLRALSATDPDLSYPALAQVLRRAGETAGDENEKQMRELFTRMVFNILIDNTDDHEKNHSLLFIPSSRAGKLFLAPAYDMLPTNSGQGHQEFGVGAQGRDSTLSNAMSRCTLFGFDNKTAAAEVARVISIVDGWKEHFAECGVTGSDIENLADRIDGPELLGERRGFNPADYAKGTLRARRRPFG
jgi:serine/threonine-protein kinase HipA